MKHSALNLAGLGIALFVGLVLRLLAMGRGMGQDELFTVVNFVDVPSIWTTISTNDAFNNHVGYSLVAHLAEGAFGRAEWVFRLPALVLGVATIPLVWLHARSIVPFPIPLLTTFLLAVSPPHIIWSTNARAYSALVFFTLLATLAYTRLLQRPRRREAVLFVAISVLGIYFHLYAAYVTLVQALLLIRIQAAHRGRLWPLHQLRIRVAAPKLVIATFPVIAFATFMCYVPMLRQMAHDFLSRGRGELMPTFPVDVLSELSGTDSPARLVVFVAIAALGLVALARASHRAAVYVACLFVVPITLMVLSRPFDLYPRFFAYLLPYLLLCLAAGLATLWRAAWLPAGRSVRMVGSRLAVVAVVAFVFIGWGRAQPTYQADEGYRAASQAALRDTSGSVPICALGGARTVWAYYIGRPPVTPHTLDEFLALTRSSPEVRCVYYQAAWQDDDQTRIAGYLEERAIVERFEDLVVFTYRS